MLAKILKSGYLRHYPDQEIFQIKPFDDNKNCIDIPYRLLTNSDWGYLYEKHVGQYFENLGYVVDYNGLSKGFLDGGIDLIAKNEQHIYFIQCKYQKKNKLTKSKIENILYKGSNKISKMKHSRSDVFALVIPDKDTAFRKVKTKSNTLIQKYKYPMYDYFLSKNSTQSQIKLEIIEIPM